MSSGSDAEERGGAFLDTSPRFSIGQLFTMLLQIAEETDALNPDRPARDPCLACLRWVLTGEHPLFHGLAPEDGWTHVSPRGSAFLAANHPRRQPPPTSKSAQRSAAGHIDDAIEEGWDSSPPSAHTQSPLDSSPVHASRELEDLSTLHPDGTREAFSYRHHTLDSSTAPIPITPTSSARVVPSRTTSSVQEAPTQTQSTTRAPVAVPSRRPTTTSTTSRARNTAASLASVVGTTTGARTMRTPGHTPTVTPPALTPRPSSSTTPVPTIQDIPVVAGGAPSQVWYSVTCGRRVGVFDNLSVVVWSVNGVRGNASRSFSSREDAEMAFKEAEALGLVTQVP
ncbi:hypothetical protein C8Q79DRAFT_1007340 [Trametes meyenii]|nr:hypothetical protein C8Q79DRAFT_1007340 [Trametes meyenii]